MAHEAQPIHLSAKTGSRVRIAVNVDFLLCQLDHILRACNDAQLASLATLGVDHNRTFNLAHIDLNFLVKSLGQSCVRPERP